MIVGQMTEVEKLPEASLQIQVEELQKKKNIYLLNIWKGFI